MPTGPNKDFFELPGLRVTVDQVLYQPEAETPLERPHCFVYFITIHNDSAEVVTIKGRKWVVRNDRGDVTVVEGDGVVGEFPVIDAGEKFTYNSYHVFDTRSAIAEGSYIGLDSKGRAVLTRIPPFRMSVPES